MKAINILAIQKSCVAEDGSSTSALVKLIFVYSPSTEPHVYPSSHVSRLKKKKITL